MAKKVVISSAVLGAVAIGVAILLVKRKGSTRFKRKAVKTAKKEWEIWNSPTKKTESDSGQYKHLKKYWDSVGKKPSSWDTDDAWSAVFISYLMQEAKMKDDFNYSARHSDYINSATKNKLGETRGKAKAYRLEEKKVKVGDLICNSREAKDDYYGEYRRYKSHCDIVVKKNRKQAEVIGGNLQNSVSKQIIPLENGFVKRGNKRFVVISTK